MIYCPVLLADRQKYSGTVTVSQKVVDNDKEYYKVENMGTSVAEAVIIGATIGVLFGAGVSVIGSSSMAMAVGNLSTYLKGEGNKVFKDAAGGAG